MLAAHPLGQGPAPNGRVLDSPFYVAKLAWFDRLARWLSEAINVDTPAVLGGDLNVAPEDVDVRIRVRIHPIVALLRQRRVLAVRLTKLFAKVSICTGTNITQRRFRSLKKSSGCFRSIRKLID